MKTPFHAVRLAVRFTLVAALFGAILSLIACLSAVLTPTRTEALHSMLWPQSTVLHWFALYYFNALIIWFGMLGSDYADSTIIERAKTTTERERERIAAALCFEHYGENIAQSRAYYISRHSQQYY